MNRLVVCRDVGDEDVTESVPGDVEQTISWGFKNLDAVVDQIMAAREEPKP